MQNKTPSIIKFISKLSNKKDTPIAAVCMSPEKSTYKINISAEKRICSDSDESIVKRLKLEDINTTSVEIGNAIDEVNSPNKENKITCITLE